MNTNANWQLSAANTPETFDWVFGRDYGEIATKKQSRYWVPYGIEFFTVDVIAVGRIDPDKGYCMGHYGLN